MIRLPLGQTLWGKPVVNHIGFEMADGEVFGLLGPNAAGKTTTMETVKGLRLNGLDLFHTAWTLTFLSIGFIIASLARALKSAGPVAGLISFPLIFVGGSFFPYGICRVFCSRWSKRYPSFT